MTRKSPSRTFRHATGQKFPEQPLAQETGGWKKKWSSRLPIGLVYPNSYGIGISNLGYQLVYDRLNQDDGIVCERIFLPEDGSQPRSLESNRAMTDFAVVFVAVSFEQDYFNLVKLLRASGIAPLTTERAAHGAGTDFPLLIGGGVACLINPEPLAVLLDAIIVGEFEPVMNDLVRFLLDKAEFGKRPEVLWQMAATIPGCYVPEFYAVEYDALGRVEGLVCPAGLPPRIRKNVADCTLHLPGCSTVMTPQAEFADMFLVELGRGCSRGCRFCAAGYVYRPPRQWSSGAVSAVLQSKPAKISRIGLIGMEMVPPASIQQISEAIGQQACSLSFASLRADVLSPELLAVLAASDQKTIAIAPDGGSERLRLVINKGITRDDVLRGSAALCEAGVKNVKLYFMIGLPTETDEDLNELVRLVLEVKREIGPIGRKSGRMPTVIVSINCFVPKAWTPFQYAAFLPVQELNRRLQYIRMALSGQSNLRVIADSPANAYFQAVLARGNRQVGRALTTLEQPRAWQRHFQSLAVDPANFALREREKDEIFPWDIIDHGIQRDYLWEEYQRALNGRISPVCDPTRCHRCGVC